MTTLAIEVWQVRRFSSVQMAAVFYKNIREDRALMRKKPKDLRPCPAIPRIARAVFLAPTLNRALRIAVLRMAFRCGRADTYFQ